MNYWSPDYAGCGPTSYGTVTPRPYLHTSLRHDARIQQLNREQRQRLRERIEQAIRDGDRLTWAQEFAVQRGILEQESA